MRTQPRPEIRSRRVDTWTVVGEALLALGFAGFVLGIYEVGGLLTLGAGFVCVWVGMVAALLGDRRRLDRDDETFRWVVSEGPPG